MKQIISFFCLTALFAVFATSCGDDDNKELQQFTVTFDSQDGSKVASQTITYGEKVVEPTKPTKEGHAFIGWYTETSFTHAWDFERDIVTKDITLYAKWEIAEFTVTFNTNGGSTIEPVAAAKGSKIQRPLPPTKDGFAFDNWYTDNELTHVYDFNTPINGNITLYAKWIEAAQITKELLQSLIDEAEAINSENYTDASAENLHNKLNAAYEIIHKDNPTAQELQNAYQALKTAISELVELPKRTTVGLEIYPLPVDGIIYVNTASNNGFYLNAYGIDSKGDESTNNAVTFEYSGLDEWAEGEIYKNDNNLSFSINPLLQPGKSIAITIKSAEFPSIVQIVTLKSIGAEEAKSVFITTVNALPSIDQVTIENYDKVWDALEKAWNLHNTLSEQDRQDPAVIAAYTKLDAFALRMEHITKLNYSFEGNLCKFSIDGDVMYADYTANGKFPAGTYILREWEEGSVDDDIVVPARATVKYYNSKLVLKSDNTLENYERESDNPEGSNPTEWKLDSRGTYQYNGNQSSGGSMLIKFDSNDNQYSLKTSYSQNKKAGKTSLFK